MSGGPPIESLLRRDRWLVGSALVVAIVLSWAWIVPMCRDMYGSMSGSAAWMMTRTWDKPHLLLLFAMWAVMMVGMMLPSAAPAVLLYGAVVRKSPDADRVAQHMNAFAGGYIVIWTLFSALATILQRLLAHAALISPMMAAQDRRFGGGLLILAGLYQLTPLKRACLRSCRSPAEFLARHWRRGIAGGFWLGFLNGLFCLGCCWALMLLLFAGGVMNLWWIAGLTIFVLLEKLAPFGAWGGRLSGIVIALIGLWSVR